MKTFFSFHLQLGSAVAACLASLAAAFVSASVIAAAGMGPAPSVAVVEPMRDPARGRALYAKSCARCHGEKGEGHGDDDDGPDLHALRISNARIATVVRAGIHGEMPSFGKKMPSEDIGCMVAYLRTLH